MNILIYEYGLIYNDIEHSRYIYMYIIKEKLQNSRQ